MSCVKVNTVQLLILHRFGWSELLFLSPRCVLRWIIHKRCCSWEKQWMWALVEQTRRMDSLAHSSSICLMASSASSTCKHSTESCAQSVLSCRLDQVRARHAVTGMGSIPPSLGAYGRGFVMMAFITEASHPQPAPPVCNWETLVYWPCQVQQILQTPRLFSSFFALQLSSGREPESRPRQSKKLTMGLIAVGGAQALITETREKLGITASQDVTGCSDDFKELVAAPTIGALNLKRHLLMTSSQDQSATKIRERGGRASKVCGISGALVSTDQEISAEELLRKYKQGVQETRRHKAEERQRRWDDINYYRFLVPSDCYSFI
uniref:Uncharacterized protein n=1 Tax=Eptatretus burgeri TaxID=7764 RepID=A0A8C4N5X6_EPTBU